MRFIIATNEYIIINYCAINNYSLFIHKEKFLKSQIVHTFFLNILSIYICILRFLFYLIELLVYKYIYLIYLKKSMNDFRNFSLCKYIYRTARICWTTGIISRNSLKTSKKLIYLPKLKVCIVMRVNFCKLFSINTTSCHTERVFSGILHHVQMYIKTFSSSFDRFI